MRSLASFCRVAALSLLFALCGIVLPGLAGRALATPSNVGLGKTLCTSLPTDLASMNAACSVNTSGVQAFVPVFYAIRLNNLLGPNPDVVTLTEQYPTPPHFTPTGVTCRAIAGTGFGAVFFSQSPPLTTIGPFTIPAGQEAVCFVQGYFNHTGASGLQNTATVTDATGSNSASQATSVLATASLPTDLSIVKTATPVPPASPATPNAVSVAGGPGIVHYKIVVTSSASGAPIYVGPVFEVIDQLAVIPSSVPLTAALVAGSVTCVNSSYASGSAASTADCPAVQGGATLTLSTTPVLFRKWLFPSGQPGFIAPGATITIEFDVSYARLPDVLCTKGHDGVRNTAFFDFNAAGATATINDQNSNGNNNTTPNVDTDVITGMTAVDPYCATPPPPNPLLTITKIQMPPATPTTGFTWGSVVNYKITVHNNSTTATYTNLTVDDLVRSNAYTPPFTAVAQAGGSCTPNCTIATLPPPQFLSGYGVVKTVASATIGSLAPNATVTWLISVKYTTDSCRTFTGTGIDSLNPIGNRGAVSFTAGGNSYGYVSSPVVTKMASIPMCHLVVTKTAPTVNRIKFNTWLTYAVTYKNADPVTRTVGTLIDALRILQSNYAASLTVDFNYSCGGTGVGMPNPTGSGTLYVTYTQQPDQGVRVIQNSGPVVFQAGATLSCSVGIKVSGPPQSTQFCLSDREPMMENLALMDMSSTYNPNLNWPPTPTYNPTAMTNGVNTNWATVRTPMPRCVNLLVNKSVQPTGTWTTGGPNLTYTLTVQNLGDTIPLPGGGGGATPYLTDLFAAPAPTMISPPTLVGCVPGSIPPCGFTWSPPLAAPYNPFTLRIQNLDHNQTMTFTYTVQGTYQVPSVVNAAAAYIAGVDPDNWYAANSTSCAGNPLGIVPAGVVASTCAKVEVPVLNVAPLNIVKVVAATAPAVLPASATFQVTSNCTPFAGAWNATSTLTYPGGLTKNIYMVPVGSQCRINEIGAQPNHIPMPGCPNGFASWTTSYPNATGPDGTTQSRTITWTVENVLKVKNLLACEPAPPMGSLTILKTITNLAPPPLPPQVAPPATTFPVKVSCVYNNVTTVTNLTFSNPPSAPAPQTINGIPIGSVCSVDETPWPPPFVVFQGAYPCPATERWSLATYPNPQGPDGTTRSVTIQAGANTLEVHNTFACDTQLGSLKILKTFQITPIRLADAIFAFNVVCLQPPSNNQVYSGTVYMPFINPPNNNPGTLSLTVPNLPVGSVCTVTEVQPVSITNQTSCGAGVILKYTTPTYLGSNSVPITAGVTAIVQIRNNGTCAQPMAPPPHTDGKRGGPPPDTREPPGRSPFDIGVEKTSPGEWSAGSAGLFRFVVTNHGAPLAPPVGIVVTDNLPAGMTFVAAAGSGWTCGTSVPVSCSYGGTVATGQSLPPITVTAVAGRQGTTENCVGVALNGAADGNAGNDKSCIAVKIGKAVIGRDTSVTPVGGRAGGADVGIANVVTGGGPEGTGAFELTVTNYGAPLPDGAGIELRDTLPGGLMLVTAAPASSAWNCRTTGTGLACRIAGRIPTGMLPKIRVTVRAVRTGTFANCASVALTGADDQMASNNTSCATLRIGLDADTGGPRPPTLIVPPRHETHSDDHPDVAPPPDPHSDVAPHP